MRTKGRWESSFLMLQADMPGAGFGVSSRYIAVFRAMVFHYFHDSGRGLLLYDRPSGPFMVHYDRLLR